MEQIEGVDNAMHQTWFGGIYQDPKNFFAQMPVVPEEIRRTTVMRLDIQGWSGKEKAEAPDFPGAYRLEEVRPSP